MWQIVCSYGEKIQTQAQIKYEVFSTCLTNCSDNLINKMCFKNGSKFKDYFVDFSQVNTKAIVRTDVNWLGQLLASYWSSAVMKDE